MHFDALTLACVAGELTDEICPGRVQQVLPVDEHSIGLEVYARGQRRFLLARAAPEAARVHLVAGKLRRGVEKDSPFLLLLRKYVRDALLVSAHLPIPFERVLALRFEHREHGRTTLIAEPLGRQANLILLDAQNTILECLRHVPASGPGRRVLLPRRPYAPPPAQGKLPPLDDGTPGYAERLAALLAEAGDAPLWKTLVAGIAGVSPTLAREAAWRAAQGGDGSPAQSVAAALRDLWSPVENGAWSPGLWRVDGEPAGFSAYAVHFVPHWEASGSMSVALETVYARPIQRRTASADGSPEVGDSYAARRGAVSALVAQARARVARQLAALAKDEPEPGAADALRRQAEWLLAMQHLVQPGDTELRLDAGGETLVIPLAAGTTPVAQAQRMFKQAARQERAAAFIPQRRAQLQIDLAFLDQLALDAAEARSQPELAAVRDELAAAGLLPQPPGKRPAPAPRAQGGPATFRAGDVTILVGRNARQNEQVTFGRAHPDDVWLHVRGHPGAHVVVRCDGCPVDAAAVAAAARLAAYYSDARGEPAVDVIVARRRDVKRAPGGHTGQVIVRNEETLRVPAQMPEDVTPA